MRVYDILMQKIEEIQSRLPMRMNIPGKSFRSVLQTTLDSSQSTTDSRRINSIAGKASGQSLSGSFNLPVDGKTMEYIEACIKEASNKYGIDSELIRAVIKYESGFNPRAVSSAGAEGLMQLMPETARILGVKDSFDIRQNIDGGTCFLRDMLYSFNGDLELSLAAYNAGPATVRRYGGVPPYEETIRYIENVLKDYRKK
jgi:soluble lytic murein transglycosylase-like protein